MSSPCRLMKSDQSFGALQLVMFMNALSLARAYPRLKAVTQVPASTIAAASSHQAPSGPETHLLLQDV